MTKKKQFFGTDGIRGQANIGKMTPDSVMRFGMAAGKYFRQNDNRRHSVVIGTVSYTHLTLPTIYSV